MDIKVVVVGTEMSRAIDKDEIFEMNLGESEGFCKNNGIAHNLKDIEEFIQDRSEMMGDKVVSVELS